MVAEIFLRRIMVAASALMVAPAHGLVKRPVVLVHIIREAMSASAFRASMPVAHSPVSLQFVFHDLLFLLFGLAVCPTVPLPCPGTGRTSGTLGTHGTGWDTLGHSARGKYKPVSRPTLSHPVPCVPSVPQSHRAKGGTPGQTGDAVMTCSTSQPWSLRWRAACLSHGMRCLGSVVPWLHPSACLFPPRLFP